MPNIAISYRRADSAAVAGRIFDHLTAQYGKTAVFMDIVSIPFGTDFRNQVREVWQRADVLIAIIGTNWMGPTASGPPRLHDPTDFVGIEIEMALAHHTPVIPLLVDGAKMPDASDLPPQLAEFAFLNAAELSSGRDFHNHMERLIQAIDLMLAPNAPAEPLIASDKMPDVRANGKVSSPKHWGIDALRYFLVPLVLLFVAHYVIVNALDLNIAYLWLACVVIPFVFGFAFCWIGRRGTGTAIVFGAALGLISVAGMTVSQGLNSGDPIVPQTRVEWRDDFQFAAVIVLGFITGHVLAGAARAMRRQGSGKRTN
jgi:hypothetical protein